MFIAKINGPAPARISYVDGDWVPPPAVGTGASQYGIVYQQVSSGRPARINYYEGDYPQLSAPIIPAGGHYLPQFRRRRR